MNSKRTQRSLHWNWAPRRLLGVMALWSFCANTHLALADEMSMSKLVPTTEEVSNLPYEEKKILLEKKLRFDQLDESEKEKRRDLYAQLSRHENGAQITGALVKYYDWLGTLSRAEQEDVFRLTGKARVAKIKELMEQQTRAKTKELGQELSSSDVDAIFLWLESQVKAHREEILGGVKNPKRAEYLRGLEKNAPLRYARQMIVQYFQYANTHKPSSEELKALGDSLSPEARSALTKMRDAEQKGQAVREWIKTAFAIRAMGPIEESELRAVLPKLTAKEREKLELKSTEDRKRELKKKVVEDRLQQLVRQDAPPAGLKRLYDMNRRANQEKRKMEAAKKLRAGAKD